MAEQQEKLTPAGSLKVTIQTPAEHTYFSRGFYQVEEDALYVPVHPGGAFYSYLDSSPPTTTAERRRLIAPTGPVGVNLDIDRRGLLLFVQVLTPRRFWALDPNLRWPQGIESAEIRFRTFRGRLPLATLQATPDSSLVRLAFTGPPARTTYYLADNIRCEIAADDSLVALWIRDIIDDRAARKMAAWRKEMKMAATTEPPDTTYTRIEIKE